MFQEIFNFIAPYLGDFLIGLAAFFGVRSSLSPKKTKEERAVLKKQNRIAKTKKCADKLSAKLSSCVQFLQAQVNEEESDFSGDSSN